MGIATVQVNPCARLIFDATAEYVQRGHQQSLEVLPQFFALLFVGAVKVSAAHSCCQLSLFLGKTFFMLNNCLALLSTVSRTCNGARLRMYRWTVLSTKLFYVSSAVVLMLSIATCSLLFIQHPESTRLRTGYALKSQHVHRECSACIPSIVYPSCTPRSLRSTRAWRLHWALSMA